MPILLPDTPLEFPGDTPGRVLDGDLTAALGGYTWGAVDDRGVRVHLASLVGWYDPAPVTGGVEQRSADDGGWLDPSWSAPRVITATLRLRGSSWPHVSQTIRDICATIPRRTTDTLYVSDNGEVLQVDVRQEGDVLVARSGVGADLSISLTAPDPRKYATLLDQQSTALPLITGGLVLPIVLPVSIAATIASGVLTAVNEGNEFTRPTLTVVGPCDAGSATHIDTGRVLSWGQAIASGRTLVIDTDKRTALLDGVSPQLVTGTWFDYAPGVNQVAFSAGVYDAASRLISAHRSAWR